MAEVRIATFNLENFDETAVGNDAGESLNPSAQVVDGGTWIGEYSTYLDCLRGRMCETLSP